jgi:hypothetical protein
MLLQVSMTIYFFSLVFFQVELKVVFSVFGCLECSV